jgi:hypothetical protein
MYFTSQRCCYSLYGITAKICCFWFSLNRFLQALWEDRSLNLRYYGPLDLCHMTLTLFESLVEEKIHLLPFQSQNSTLLDLSLILPPLSLGISATIVVQNT